jgi:hypothetical protein
MNKPIAPKGAFFISKIGDEI